MKRYIRTTLDLAAVWEECKAVVLEMTEDLRSMLKEEGLSDKFTIRKATVRGNPGIRIKLNDPPYFGVSIAVWRFYGDESFCRLSDLYNTICQINGRTYQDDKDEIIEQFRDWAIKCVNNSDTELKYLQDPAILKGCRIIHSEAEDLEDAFNTIEYGWGNETLPSGMNNLSYADALAAYQEFIRTYYPDEY